MPARRPASRPWYNRPLRLGSLAGVPIHLSTSWILITIVMVALFAPRIRGWLPSLGTGGAIALALGYTLILAVSVLLHELAHAYSARAVGWHGSSIEITLWGGHTTFHEVGATPGRSLLVSAAGPVTNLVLGGLAVAVLHLSEPGGVTGAALAMTAWGNLLLGAFNLVPGMPLDGGQVVEAIAWKFTGSRARGTIVSGWAGRVITLLGAAIMIALVATGRERSPWLFLAVGVLVLYPLWQGSSGAIAYGRLRVKVEALDLASLTEPVVTLPPGASVAVAQRSGALHGNVVVRTDPGSDGRPHLLRILPEAVVAVPDQARATTPAEQTGVDVAVSGTLPWDATGDVIVATVLDCPSETVVIVDESGDPVGTVRKENVIAALEAEETTTS